jgi:hypothetical protein
MKLFAHALLITGTLAASQAFACDYPVAPGKFPDGSAATKDEMVAAHRDVTKYDSDMKAYLECLATEYNAKVEAQKDITPDQKAAMDKKQTQKEDAAMKEVTDTVARFNEQLKAWHEKNDPKK